MRIKKICLAAILLMFFSNVYIAQNGTVKIGIQSYASEEESLVNATITSYCIHPNSAYVYYTKGDGNIYKYDLNSRQESILLNGTNNNTYVMRVNSDGRFLTYKCEQPNTQYICDVFQIDLLSSNSSPQKISPYEGIHACSLSTPGYFSDCNSAYNVYYRPEMPNDYNPKAYVISNMSGYTRSAIGVYRSAHMVYRDYYYVTDYRGLCRISLTSGLYIDIATNYSVVTQTIPDSCIGSRYSNYLYLNASGKVYRLDTNNITSGLTELTTGMALALNNTENKLMILENGQLYELTLETTQKKLVLSALPSTNYYDFYVLSDFSGIVYKKNMGGLYVKYFNKSPTISVINPAINQVFSNDDIYIKPEIFVTDPDDDNVTCLLYIDSEAIPRDSKTVGNTRLGTVVQFKKIDISAIPAENHTIKYEITDGNATVRNSINIVVDNSPPIIDDVDISTTINSISVIGSATEPVSGLTNNLYQYSIDQTLSNWLPSGQLNPVLSSVVNTAYDISGNGVRKLVRLSNGMLVAAVNNNSTIRIFKSVNNGSSWGEFSTISFGSVTGFSIATDNQYIYLLTAWNGDRVTIAKFDLQGNVVFVQVFIDLSQSAMGACSLAVDSSGNIHTAWASKNSTYPNSFNIRYSKSTDGGATWVTPTQVTNDNTSTSTNELPCIVIADDGSPIIFHVGNNSSSRAIQARKLNGSTWSGTNVYYVNGTSYPQSNPCAVVDSNGVIHVVWQGLDSTDTSKYNIRYSKSTDNGATWSTPVKLTSGNNYDQINPSITTDNSGKVYVYWQGIDPAISSSYYNIRRKILDTGSGTWSGIETLTNNTTNHAQNPSLCSNFTDFVSPQYIYQDLQANAVKYSGQIDIPPYPFTVSGLDPNTPYLVTFKAKDNAGNISTWSQTVYTKAVHPSLTSIEASDTSVVLQINDTIEIDGRTVSNPSDTQYQITCGERYVNQLGEITTEPAWIRIPDKQITVTGLDNQVEYSFKIKARNGDGIESEPSVVVTAYTGTTKPSVPENIKAQLKSNDITLFWDEVPGAVSYDVEADGVIHTVTDNLYFTHTDLLPETTHIYRVRAINDEGQAGDWSDEIVAETLKSLPPAVLNLTAMKTSTTVQLNWSPVPGGGVVYQIQADGEIIDTGFENSYPHEGLTVNSRHTYRVRAVNSAGAGPWSSAVNVTTQFIPPVTPSNIQGVGSKTKIVVTWDKVPDAVNYYIEAKCSNPNISGTLIDNKNSTYGVIYGTPDTIYYLRIKAKNPAGESPWSEPITVRTYALDTPEFTDIQESQHEVKLSWGAVDEAASYRIERNGQFVGTTAEIEYTDTGLAAETKYSYRVKAVSADSRESNWSYAVDAITLPEKPPVPQDFYAYGSNGMVVLSWTSVAGAIAYDLEIDGVIIENGNSTSYLYKDVAPKTEHLYRVRARNSGIEGDWHPGIRLVTLPDTIQPPSIINVATTNTVTSVKWERVPDAVRYEVEVDGLVVYNGTRNEFVHRRLEPNTEHIYRIRSIGYVEASEWSDRIVNNAVTLVCDKGKNAQIGLTASDVTDFSGYTLTVVYNPDVLQVDDLCTLTSEKELTVGKIAGTDVEIVQYEAGKIVFRVDKPIELGMSWSGIINRIGFKGKVTGGTTITYTVFIKPKLIE